jgi:hypothetical protein
MVQILVFVPSRDFTAALDPCCELAKTMPHLRYREGEEYVVRQAGEPSGGGATVSYADAAMWQRAGNGVLKLVEDEPQVVSHTPKSEAVHTAKVVEDTPADQVAPVPDEAGVSEVEEVEVEAEAAPKKRGRKPKG